MKRFNEVPLSHQLIPGGAHTYSKGDDQFPANAPGYLERGEGAWVWDREGQRYLDWTMGLRSMTLGYAYGSVDDAAIAQIRLGSNFGRPSWIETELAQDLVDLIPSAEMVKFAKHGSVVTTAAVKLARAYTDRPYVAFCKDHPFFSFDDWFIGTTAANAGIPEAHYQYSLPFLYNDIGSLEAQFAAHPNQIAAVILEPCTTDAPASGFLDKVRALCTKHGTVMILDEMITGFRWHLCGAQSYFDVAPDLATFGKGMGNGYSVSALVGKREIMELGGIIHDKPRVFLISTTHGAESHCLAAARAAIQVYRTQPVIEHLWKIGEHLIAGLREAAQEAGVGNHFAIIGYPCRPEFVCRDKAGEVSLPLRTLFMQEMIRKGVLLSYIVPSYAHQQEHVDATVDAARHAFSIYARALDDGWERHLEGPPVKPVFRKFN